VLKRVSPESRSARFKKSSRRSACGAYCTQASTKMAPSSRCPSRKPPLRLRFPKNHWMTTWCNWGLPKSSVSTLTSITMTKSESFALSFARRKKKRGNAFRQPRPRLSRLLKALMMPQKTLANPRRLSSSQKVQMLRLWKATKMVWQRAVAQLQPLAQCANVASRTILSLEPRLTNVAVQSRESKEVNNRRENEGRGAKAPFWHFKLVACT